MSSIYDSLAQRNAQNTQSPGQEIGNYKSKMMRDSGMEGMQTSNPTNNPLLGFDPSLDGMNANIGNSNQINYGSGQGQPKGLAGMAGCSSGLNVLMQELARSIESKRVK